MECKALTTFGLISYSRIILSRSYYESQARIQNVFIQQNSEHDSNCCQHATIQTKSESGESALYVSLLRRFNQRRAFTHSRACRTPQEAYISGTQPPLYIARRIQSIPIPPAIVRPPSIPSIQNVSRSRNEGYVF
jgi:hypothetical protein